MLEDEMSKAVLEIIDAKLSPILEKLQKMESLTREDFERFCLSIREKDGQSLNTWKADLDKKFAELDKKFVVVARLIESVMDGVEKTTSARKCEADIKGIKLLKGEPQEP